MSPVGYINVIYVRGTVIQPNKSQQREAGTVTSWQHWEMRIGYKKVFSDGA